MCKPTNNFIREKIKSRATETPMSPVSGHKAEAQKQEKSAGDDLYRKQAAQWLERSCRHASPEGSGCFAERLAGRQKPHNNSEDHVIQNITKLCTITVILVGKLKAVLGLNW